MSLTRPGSHCRGSQFNPKSKPAQTIAWNCAYHVLLAHAAAVKRFRVAVPGGKISMNINSDWSEPYSSSAQDQVHPLHVLDKPHKSYL